MAGLWSHRSKLERKHLFTTYRAHSFQFLKNRVEVLREAAEPQESHSFWPVLFLFPSLQSRPLPRLQRTRHFQMSIA